MSEEQKPTAPSGAPQWTYIVGAIGVIGTLIWTVTSYFIPKAETPPAKPVAAASAPAVNVSGSGNVGVGTMSGGSISVNAPTAPASMGR